MSDSDDHLQQYGNIISGIAFITAIVMGIIHGIGMFWEENKPKLDEVIPKNPEPTVVQPRVIQPLVVQAPVVQPQNNLQGVSYEPWHWRFVGSQKAQDIFRMARMKQ